MSENSVCTLQILLDPQDMSADQFKKETEILLQAHMRSIRLDVDTTDSRQLVLTLQGALAIIDECHDLINKNLIERPQRTCVRLIDDAGDTVRQQAYPILARIEQRFRAFTNRAMTEVFGFDWWDTFAPMELQIKVSQIRNRDKEDGPVLHPLEYTQFDDLVDLITAEVSKWEDSKPLTAAKLLEILSGCNSINEAITRLQEKTKKVSYWDRVFARYFQDRSQWDEIKQSLSFVIKQRHKVMHHRPIRLAIVQTLFDRETKLQQLFLSAKPKLSAQERAEAQQDIKELQMAEHEHRRQGMLEELAISSKAFEDIPRLNQEILAQLSGSAAVKAYEETERRIREMMAPLSGSAAAKAYEEMEHRNQEMMARVTAPAVKAFEEMQRRNQEMMAQLSGSAAVKAYEEMEHRNQEIMAPRDLGNLKDSDIPEARMSPTRKSHSRRRGSSKKPRQAK